MLYTFLNNYVYYVFFNLMEKAKELLQAKNKGRRGSTAQRPAITSKYYVLTF